MFTITYCISDIMDTTNINIIIIGIVLIGLVAMYLNQIELASVALGGIVGFLSKQNITIEASSNEVDSGV